MLGPEIEGKVAQGGFGHNGLASAAGSTLAADPGSRSIGFQFHRADIIDAVRTGSAREIRRRTRVVGAFPDGQSALNLAAARLRHIAGTAWSTKRYLNIELLKHQQMRGAITA
jgi:hypothetical protein